MKTYHLFISHSWAYSAQYNNLIHLLNQAQNFTYRDFSIPKNDPVHSGSDSQLSKAIQNQMQSCGIVLVLAGTYASCSKWIDKEIKIAKSTFSSPKPILAIEPYGSQKTSQTAKERADEIVRWNTDSIVAAIKRLA